MCVCVLPCGGMCVCKLQGCVHYIMFVCVEEVLVYLFTQSDYKGLTYTNRVCVTCTYNTYSISTFTEDI